MAPHIFPTDEELGKRDDDYVSGSKATKTWRNVPYNYRRRRVAVVIGAVCLVWLLLHVFSRPEPGYEAYDATNIRRPIRPKGPPPKVMDDMDEVAAQHYYTGHIKFFELGSSLHELTNTNGLRAKNRNVLFAASDLKSVSSLIPLACEMAKWNRNYVHFAIMGRYDIQLDDILEVNGVDREGCAVYWHDARPDYVTYSSDVRAEAVVMAAMGHIQTFMHPQVAIMGDSLREDQFFVRGMRKKTEEQSLPVIEIPTGRADSLEWLTRLDSGSLRSWHAPSVDILIHAQQHSSGSLIRLLQSIQAADYSGLTPPRITVELPADIDPASVWFLERMVWPPAPKDPIVKPHQNSLAIRHRIPDQQASSEEAPIRFLESFYPSLGSHVLLLAPNAQLSPLYYQYLMFHLLEYRYSAYAGTNNDHLLGLSLEVPSHYLNGTTEFAPPTTSDMRVDKYKQGHADATVPFTWQAPNSNAALYFGDKWAEIHSFLTNRLRAFRLQSAPVPRPRTIHESLPSWLEYFLELMRARGYALHYPAGPADSAAAPHYHALVSVHNELYQPPEEMLAAMAAKRDASDDTPPDTLPDDVDTSSSPFLTGSPAAALTPPLHLEPALAADTPLHQMLPFDADPPELRALPALSHRGELVEEAGVEAAAREVTRKFRGTIGGCGADRVERAGRRRVVRKGGAGDLFCLGDEEWEVVEDGVEGEGEGGGGEGKGVEGGDGEKVEGGGERGAGGDETATGSGRVDVEESVGRKDGGVLEGSAGEKSEGVDGAEEGKGL